MKLEDLKNLDLAALDFENIGSWPLPARGALLALVFLAVLGIGYYVQIGGLREELARAEKEEKTLREEFSTKQARAASLDAYKAQLEEMQRSFGAMLRQLPGKTEVENLLVDISQAALASGLETELFQPQGEQPKEFYAELPIKMRLSGGYHEFGAFASNVAALPRIVTLHDITIAPSKTAATARGAGAGGAPPVGTGTDLVMDVTAKTYRYLDDEEVAAQAAAAKEKDKKKGGKK
ncbi:MAG TPA: type 4a pilus biogenesis protein PilO [Gammaproteobacteria bacterium]|nr:type 4a pilus biogenesis protein PilO [Gammaproteobacteria bacterium]